MPVRTLEEALLNSKTSRWSVACNKETGMPLVNIVKKNGKNYKEIVCNANGFVKPTEMVAILGPSGSGKTSLLNTLSQRSSLSGGSFTAGDIQINGRNLRNDDFGKIGAFVQQDDVLMATMTPYECLKFACRLATSLNPE
jgi:ABC-type multidrug transport system ATPase subunit